VNKSGAQIFVSALEQQGVDTLFGFPGGAVLPIFDALYDCTKIRFILMRHEQAAAHAADGYARASGKVGVCIATSGPGATNLVTGIATAHMDSVPMVAFTGQVPTHFIGNDAFQEADITGITRPITKHNYLVSRLEDLPRTIAEAFHIAGTGRPGPVLVDIPKDIQSATMDYDEEKKWPVQLRGYRPTYHGHPKQIARAADLIMTAQRPVLYVGGGVISSNATEELAAFARKTGIPLAWTLMGIGAFPSDDPLGLGMLGMHGTVAANYTVSHSDLVIAVGARFDDRVIGRTDRFAVGARIIHIDIDPSSISKSILVHCPIVGDAKRILEALLARVDRCDIDPWRECVDSWKNDHPLCYQKDDLLRPQYVLECMHRVSRGQAIIATEVGQNQMWAAQHFIYSQPRTFLSSGGLGTMGYGFPAAIGAQVAHPDKIVFDVAGDGSIQMNIQEMATVVQEKIPVKIVILNNGCLGMVRQWQELFYDRRYSHTHLPDLPDFVKLAEAYGAHGRRVDRKEDVLPALEWAVAVDGPVLLDFRVNPEENVFPMVPAGGALDEMMVSPS